MRRLTKEEAKEQAIRIREAAIRIVPAGSSTILLEELEREKTDPAGETIKISMALEDLVQKAVRLEMSKEEFFLPCHCRKRTFLGGYDFVFIWSH
jgi:hypothetical protein